MANATDISMYPGMYRLGDAQVPSVTCNQNISRGTVCGGGVRRLPSLAETESGLWGIGSPANAFPPPPQATAVHEPAAYTASPSETVEFRQVRGRDLDREQSISCSRMKSTVQLETPNKVESSDIRLGTSSRIVHRHG
jgi:hypothetical protein